MLQFYSPCISCLSFFLPDAQIWHVLPFPTARLELQIGRAGPGAARQKLHCYSWATCPPSSYTAHGEQGVSVYPCLPLELSVFLTNTVSLISICSLNCASRSQHYGWETWAGVILLVRFSVACLASPDASMSFCPIPELLFGFYPGLRILPG